MENKKCLNCGKELTHKKNKKYCSYACYFAKRDFSGINNHRYGIAMSEETKRKIVIANTGKLAGRPSPLRGRVHTEEHNKKISENTSKALLAPGMKERLQSMLGRHHTEESKLKSRESNLGLKRSDEFKKKMHKIAIDRLINHTMPYKETRPELMVRDMLIELGFNKINRNDIRNPERIEFIHQYYMSIKHDYLADFVFPELKAVIEEDGVYYHKDDKEQVEIDTLRTFEMESLGYSVLRVTDQEVLHEYDIVKGRIRRFIVDCEFKKLLPEIGVYV